MIWSVLGWEFLQNLPLVMGLVLALQFWQQGQFGAAVASVLSGSVLGALIIYATESKIVSGHREPVRVALTNAVAISLLMLVLVLYFSGKWSSWKTDLAGGCVVGVVLGATQDLAASEPIGLRHGLALGLASALGLVSIRLLAVNLPSDWIHLALAGGLITAVVTGVIGLLDYGVMRPEKS